MNFLFIFLAVTVLWAFYSYYKIKKIARNVAEKRLLCSSTSGDEREMAVRIYNGVVNDFLMTVDSFPSIFIAKIMKIEKPIYIELDTVGIKRV